MSNVSKIKGNQVTRQNGEQARLKVVKGADYGFTFILLSTVASIGRGEDNDVVLSDLKASRHHCELSLGPGGWTLKDSGSANGVILNGGIVKNGLLKNKDTILVGETTLEFFSSEVNTQILISPPKIGLDAVLEARGLDYQQKRLQSMTTFGGKYSGAGGVSRNSSPASKVRALSLIAVVGIIVFYFSENPDKIPDKLKRFRRFQRVQKTAQQDEPERNIANILTSSEASPEVKASAEKFFKLGFREFREKNYLRARKNFETALSIHRGYKLAEVYRMNAEDAIDKEVTYHLRTGKKEISRERSW